MIKFEDVTHLFNPDFDALRDHVRLLEATVPKAGGTMFNGWTVMGKNGKHTDAWVDGSAFVKKLADGRMWFDYPSALKANYWPNAAHDKFTNASSPELEQLLDKAKNLGLKPCRARLIQLVPGAASSWHSDGLPETLVLRLHVVIESNPLAVFKTAEGATHLPANRVYLINVNDYHSVENHGDSVRTHLVTDVTDSNSISKVHR
jgi:hypothetical protein